MRSDGTGAERPAAEGGNEEGKKEGGSEEARGAKANG